jgi:hypothetical protein
MSLRGKYTPRAHGEAIDLSGSAVEGTGGADKTPSYGNIVPQLASESPVEKSPSEFAFTVDTLNVPKEVRKLPVRPFHSAYIHPPSQATPVRPDRPPDSPLSSPAKSVVVEQSEPGASQVPASNRRFFSWLLASSTQLQDKVLGPTPQIVAVDPTSPASSMRSPGPMSPPPAWDAEEVPDAVRDFLLTRYHQAGNDAVDQLVRSLNSPASVPPTIAEDPDSADIPPLPEDSASVPPLPWGGTPTSQPPRPRLQKQVSQVSQLSNSDTPQSQSLISEPLDMMYEQPIMSPQGRYMQQSPPGSFISRGPSFAAPYVASPSYRNPGGSGYYGSASMSPRSPRIVAFDLPQPVKWSDQRRNPSRSFHSPSSSRGSEDSRSGMVRGPSKTAVAAAETGSSGGGSSVRSFGAGTSSLGSRPGVVNPTKLDLPQGDGSVEASPESPGTRMGPILFAAVRHNKFETVEQMLAQKPQLIDMVDETNKNNSLLHVACINGYARIARLLVKFGVNVDATNIDGNTPLHLCYQYGRSQLISVLIANGANENARNRKDMIPAQMISGSIPTSINTSPGSPANFN